MGPVRRPPRLVIGSAAILAAAAVVTVVSFGSQMGPGRTAAPSLVDDAVITARAFIAAVGDHDYEAAMAMVVPDPAVLQWPNTVGPYEVPLTDPEWFAFQKALDGRVVVEVCDSRDPAPSGRDRYDAIVECDVAVSDLLVAEVGGPPVRGRLDFGVRAGRVVAIFWNRLGPPGVLNEISGLRWWLARHRPTDAERLLPGITWAFDRQGPAPVGDPGTPRYGAELAELLLEAVAAQP